MHNVSIIIPFFNEQNRILKSLKILKNYLIKNPKTEVILVNDGSTDLTNKFICKFKNKYKNKLKIKYIYYKKNIGKGYAIKKGILNSKNNWILICDADMSVLPNQLNIWFKKKFINNNNTAYFGSRSHKYSKISSTFLRELLGVFFKILIKILFGIKIKDTQCGFKLFNSKYIKSIIKNLKSYRFSFDVELVLLLKKKNISIKELPLMWNHKEGSRLNIILDTPKMFFDIIKIKLNS